MGFQEAVANVSSWQPGVGDAIQQMSVEITESQPVLKESYTLFYEILFVLAFQMPREKAADAQKIMNQQWTELLAETGGCSSTDLLPVLVLYVTDFMSKNLAE